MSAPAQGGAGGARGGPGGPVQLVEVDPKTAQQALSGPTSPNIPLLSTPPTQVLQEPKVDGDGEAEEEDIPPFLPEAADWEAAEAEEKRKSKPRWYSHGDDDDEAENGRPSEGDDPYEVPEGEFDPRCFIGDWTDNLGHRICVAPAEQRGGGGRRRGKGRNNGPPRLAFLAVMHKVGVPEKRFTINKDRWGENWTCGNGVLLVEESTNEAIVWETGDGRKSSWTRLPPEGAVYFDPPPVEQEFEGYGGQEVYYVMQVEGDGGENGQWYGGEWVEWNAADGAEWQQAPAEEAAAAGGEDTENQASGGYWNPNATEFVMPTTPTVLPEPTKEAPAEAAPPANPPVAPSPKLVPAGQPSPALRMRWGRTPTPSPALGPLPSPSLRPQQGPRPPPGSRSPAQGPLASPATQPAMPPKPEPPVLQLSEDSPDVKVEGAWLEWSLPDGWGKLSRFPKDFCITSPMFGVRSAANMQLAFYPNGSRTAEAGLCTVSLTRGPDSAGIKFEFLVNGRGIGPKVCLGRRYLGDYPKPFGDSEESKDEKVVVRMQVLKIL